MKLSYSTFLKKEAIILNYKLLPEGLRGGAKRYIEEHIPPGDFLQAVICNKLKESFMCADENNTKRMWDIVNFFYNEAPGACWGSEEKMRAWCLLRKEEEIK
jgi:hypothetical protein